MSCSTQRSCAHGAQSLAYPAVVNIPWPSWALHIPARALAMSAAAAAGILKLLLGLCAGGPASSGEADDGDMDDKEGDTLEAGTDEVEAAAAAGLLRGAIAQTVFEQAEDVFPEDLDLPAAFLRVLDKFDFEGKAELEARILSSIEGVSGQVCPYPALWLTAAALRLVQLFAPIASAVAAARSLPLTEDAALSRKRRSGTCWLVGWMLPTWSTLSRCFRLLRHASLSMRMG